MTRGHGLQEQRVQRELRRLRDGLLKLRALRLTHASQIQISFCQSSRLKKHVRQKTRSARNPIYCQKNIAGIKGEIYFGNVFTSKIAEMVKTNFVTGKCAEISSI